VARSKIPDPLERRHLVERGLNEARAGQVAQAYLADGRELESLDFLKQAGDEEGLAGVRRSAIAAGDVFLLRAVAAAQGRAPERQEWEELAAAAEAAGKLRYAEDARRQAGRGED
jgi:hypothetical protein